MLQMSAKDLLERFLWELSEEQKYLDLDQHALSQTGNLQVSIGYLMDKAEVEVSIIQARNLMGKG